MRIGFYKNDGAEKFLEFFRKIKEETKAIKRVKGEMLLSEIKGKPSYYCEVEFYTREYTQTQGKKIWISLDYDAFSPLRVNLPGKVVLLPDLLIVEDKKSCYKEEYHDVTMTFYMKVKGAEDDITPIAEMLLCEYLEGTEFEEEDE